MPRPALLLLLLAILACMAWPTSARADVRRCTGSDGTLVFTDRRCEDIGASERVPRDAPQAASSRMYRGGCSRNLQDLVYEMTSAIDSRDVNRLGSLYHWVGMSNRSAYGVMGRLDAIAQRPLVDIVALQPVRRVAVEETYGAPAGVDANGASPNGSDASFGAEVEYVPRPSVNRSPVGLRLEQTLANGSTPSRTVLGLRRHLGCWWITL